ncbi:MAG TPA: uroporphyrinogen decarboxylase family protein [Kiritimatiellia bacterium]|nr:uroporphyrinogen decarboxylase family protein [Kiritimatiellia bacterium]HRU70366.1 uroporphyrinogen decarboxylase family protein [Kiritimatiellia bacterium]
MTPRDRILTVLRGGIPDRVPVVPFIQEEFLAWVYPERKGLDRVTAVLDLARELGFDVITKHNRFMTPSFLLRDHLNWRVRCQTAREKDLWVTRTEIGTPNRTLTEERVKPDAGAATAGVMPMTRKHLLETPDDMEAFIRWLPEPDAEDVRVMRETAAAWRRQVGDLGINAPWGWAGVFNYASDFWGIENLMMAPYTDETVYHALMAALTDRMIAYNAPLIEGGADAIGIQGHIANARSVSVDYFMTYVYPYEKRLIDALHGAGAFSVYHNCGFARAFYPCYRELGMTVWETVAEEPQGDNTLADAKAALGDRVCLLGNLNQLHFLKTASPEEVAARTCEIVSTGKPGGRYLFAASDFLERGTPIRNVTAMLRAAEEAGVY